MRRAWARLTERLDEIEAAPVVIAVGLFLVAFISGLVWRRVVTDVVLAAAFVWLAWNWGLLHTRTDQALDDADQALGRVEAVENHLTGLEPPGLGRHARSASPAPHPEGTPL